MTQITINQGTLQGGKCVTGNGYEYFEFLDIPYAKPPVGKLRFQVPQPLEKWEGIRDATVADENHINYQMHMFDNNKLKGSEDCLYLNVYIPKLPSVGSKLLPVMVHIHGGGFVMGNGTLKTDGGPDFLIENEVIVVTINFRLGVFGFLSLDIPEAAGNMGLKDQVMALKWIQENINKFGGDKDNVTLFGISAGGAAIEYLILSPLAEGLFHKAITQSGSSLNTWAFYPNIKELSVKYAQDLGYQGAKDDDRAVYNFLLEQPMEVLGTAQSELSKLTKRTCFGFGPSIEKDFGNGTAFLARSPKEILKNGKVNKVDVLSGFCQYEGILLGSMKPDVLKELSEQKNFTDFWTYPISPAEAETYNLKLKNAYFGDSLNNQDNQLAAIDYYGDVDFAAGVWIRSKWLAKRGISVYSYMFTYNSNWNLKEKIFVQTKLWRTGACHGDDMPYILKVALLDDVPATPSDLLMIKRMTKMWTDFAKTGNPTPRITDLTPIHWPRFDVNNPKYLKIDKHLEILTDYMPEKMAIFEDLYEKTYL